MIHVPLPSQLTASSRGYSPIGRRFMADFVKIGYRGKKVEQRSRLGVTKLKKESCVEVLGSVILPLLCCMDTGWVLKLACGDAT